MKGRRSALLVAWFGAQWLAPQAAAYVPVGATGSALNFAAAFVACFLAVIVAWGLLSRLVRLLIRLVRQVRESNSTSIADFIASRLGQDGWLAAAVTFVAVLGIVAYIALQLKAVAMSYALLTHGREPAPPPWQDSALYVALAMALFAVLILAVIGAAFYVMRPVPPPGQPDLHRSPSSTATPIAAYSMRGRPAERPPPRPLPRPPLRPRWLPPRRLRSPRCRQRRRRGGTARRVAASRTSGATVRQEIASSTVATPPPVARCRWGR